MKRLLVVGSIVVLCIALAGMLVWVVSPGRPVLSATEKEHALENMLGRTPVLTNKKIDTTQQVFHGHLISFSYPSSSRIYTSSSQPNLDLFSFGVVPDHIVVSVQANSNNSNALSTYGAVVLRANQPDIYTKSMTTLLGHSCISFLKTTDGVEQSLFCQKDMGIISAVVTGPDTQSVSDSFTKLLSTLSF